MDLYRLIFGRWLTGTWVKFRGQCLRCPLQTHQTVVTLKSGEGHSESDHSDSDEEMTEMCGQSVMQKIGHNYLMKCDRADKATFLKWCIVLANM